MYLIFLDSFQLYVLVYVRYMSLDIFPIYCIVYVRNIFLGDLLFFFCLHPFHVMGWFSYVFALYTFVTFL